MRGRERAVGPRPPPYLESVIGNRQNLSKFFSEAAKRLQCSGRNWILLTRSGIFLQELAILAKVGALCMAGISLKDQDFTEEIVPKYLGENCLYLPILFCIFANQFKPSGLGFWV